MRAAGMPEGKSILGGLSTGQEVIVEDGVAKMPDRMAFAGSVATTDRLVRTMCFTAGIPLTEAVKMASETPARIMKCDVAIIGGGPAGYTAAERAAEGGLSTILFEKNALGGVCLNEGCVPTKTLLYSAKVFDTIKHGFRGNGELAKQLLDQGLYLSFGKQFQTESLQKAEKDSRLFAETDDKETEISTVYQHIATTLAISLEDLTTQIEKNIKEIFPSLIQKY